MLTRGGVVAICLCVALVVAVGLGVGLTRGSASAALTDWGVCYDTGILQDASEIRECILSDFQRIRDAGYSVVRTYFPKYGFAPCGDNNVGLYAELAQITGLKLILGVGTNDYETYKACILRQVRVFPDQVLAVCIGNEDVQDGNWQRAQQILQHASDLRGQVSVRVGTAQQSGFGVCAFAGVCTSLCPDECKSAYREMRQQLDFMGFNVYPGSRGGPAIATQSAQFNRESTLAQFELLRANVPNLVITECGMPHAGQCYDESGQVQTYSRALQTELLDDIRAWHESSGVASNVFMAFDVPSKPDAPGCAPYASGEKTFGVLTDQQCARAE